MEQIETEYKATYKKLEAVKRQQKAALSGVNEVSYRRESTEAAIQRTTAALEMARLNLSYTVVIAPCDGKLGRRTLEEGRPFVTAGQTITYILPDTQKWIVANYKETQIENLCVGQEVTITVDAISKRSSRERLPPFPEPPDPNIRWCLPILRPKLREDTATHTVRIDFTHLSAEDNERLAAGMMAVVKAKL